MAAALILAWLIARWGIDLLARSLPPAMSNPLANGIDLDGRALVFLAIATASTWMLTSLPIAMRASRANLLDLLKREGRTGRLTIGSGLRQALTVAQIALTVVLLVGAVLIVRTYTAQIALAKGFDSHALATVAVSQASPSSISAASLGETLLTTLRSQSGIVSVSRTDGLPPSTGAAIGGKLSIDGRPTETASMKLATYVVDPDYFSTVGIRPLAGRFFSAADPAGSVVVDENFARRYWPTGDALGARFRVGAGFAGVHEFEIVGVAAHVRVDGAETPGGDEQFLVYGRIPPNYSPLSFVVRLADERQLGALVSLVRKTAPGSVVRAELVEDRYKRLYGDVQLAASITSGFGALAFALAIAGVYGLMLFLVTARKREIGVRLALGASPAGIRHMVLRSSAKLVGIGTALGVVGAVLASRYVQSLLFGVSASDPATFAVVIVLVAITALAATWLPARYAASVDPAITLRTE
jgi:putative ABC transport system permease protein